MPERLTPMQTLLMWSLLAKQGSAKQAELRPKVTPKIRKILESKKFVTSFKVSGQGNSLWLKVLDDGWAWAPIHLRDPLPPTQAALHDMLTRLHDHLTKSETSLADFIGGAPVPENETEARSQPATLKSIKTAYAKASGNQKAVRVFLADLRSNLPKVQRADLDQALCRAHLEGELILMRLDNPKQITPAVKDARIDFKGVPMDLIWIEK